MARRQTRKANMSTEEDQLTETSPLKDKLKGREGVHKVRTTPCSRLQAPLQSWLRPAMWIPGLNLLHSHREIWATTDSTAQRNLQNVQTAVFHVMETDTSRSDFNITKVGEDFLQIHVFTRVEWLDVIEMRFQDNTITISSFSSGALPLCLPGACFLNVVLFWVPFLDWGMNQKRLKWIRSHMAVPVEVTG